MFQVTHVNRPLPVFKIIQDKEMNNNFKDIILEHRKNNPQSNESNVKAWHSSGLTHKENPKFQPLIDFISNACGIISSQYFNLSDVDWEVKNLWAMMYEKGDYTLKHDHSIFPLIFSSCYYVDVEPDASPIIFESPEEDGVNDNNKPLIISPENGMILIWPSLLKHEVPPTNGQRMGISMNIDYKPKENV